MQIRQSRLAHLFRQIRQLAQARRPHARRVLTSWPRSGTHWLKGMVSELLGAAPLERRLNGQEGSSEADLIRAIEQNAHLQLIYDHFRFARSGQILTPEKYPDLRMVLLYRNPLDTLISRFYKESIEGNLGQPELSPLGNLRSALEDPERDLIRRYRVNIREQIIAWRSAGTCLEVRYEDLVRSPASELARVADHLLIRASRAAIDKAVANHTFQKLSGGRAPGELDAQSHYRRGVPGEWREVYSADELAVLQEELGDYLELLGYPIS